MNPTRTGDRRVVGSPRNTCEKAIWFHRWYIASIAKLKELPDGDGGFVAMAMAMPLYERFVGVARGVPDDASVTLKDISAQLASDLATEAGCSIDQKDLETFWNIFRNGILHRAFPKQPPAPPYWLFTSQISQPIQRIQVGKLDVIAVDPWQFADMVLSLWQAHPEYLDKAIDLYQFPVVGKIEVLLP